MYCTKELQSRACATSFGLLDTFRLLPFADAPISNAKREAKVSAPRETSLVVSLASDWEARRALTNDDQGIEQRPTHTVKKLTQHRARDLKSTARVITRLLQLFRPFLDFVLQRDGRGE